MIAVIGDLAHVASINLHASRLRHGRYAEERRLLGLAVGSTASPWSVRWVRGDCRRRSERENNEGERDAMRLIDYFDRGADLFPERHCLHDGTQGWTYREVRTWKSRSGFGV